MNDKILLSIMNKQQDKNYIDTLELKSQLILTGYDKVILEEIEAFLVKNGYLKVNYKSFINEDFLISYCNENNINNLKRLKNCLFRDYGVYDSDLTEQDLGHLFNSSDEEELVSDNKNGYIVHSYTQNSSYEDAVVVNDEPFIEINRDKDSIKILNLEDLIEYGLKTTVISYDLLDEFCKLNNTNHNSVRFDLNQRGIKLVSKKEDYRIYNNPKKDNAYAFKKIITFKKYGFNDKSSLAKEKFKVSPGMVKEGYKNFIFTNTNKIYIAIMKIIENNSDVLSDHFFKLLDNKDLIIKQLYNINFIKKDNENYVLTESGKRFIHCIDTNTVQNEKIFYTLYKNDILEKLLFNKPHLVFLLHIIRRINKKNKHTSYDILNYCIDNGFESDFLNTFFSHNSSNGLLPIYNMEDVCFSCYNNHKCFDSSDFKIIQEDLLYMRNYGGIKNMQLIKNGYPLSNFRDNFVFQKMMFSYSIVVTLKNFLKKTQILKEGRILGKDSGKFCSKNDVWRLNDDILV